MKKHKKITISILSIIFISICSFVFYLYKTIDNTVDKVYEPIDGETKTESKLRSENVKDKKPISILLMGVDERKNDVGRTDALIVMTLNPVKEKLQMISIPRDTRAEIVGNGAITRINSAYALGGVKMVLDTVEGFTGQKLDYYIKINMEALSGMVDALGGITVDNEIEWLDEGYYKKGYHYQLGNIDLDGEQALGYARMRKLDPRGDFGRNERQRKVIAAIIDKGTSISSVTKFKDILETLGENVKTNIPLNEMISIEKGYKNTRNRMEQYEVKGEDAYIDGKYFFVVNEEERNHIKEMLANNLLD
ncbi:MULTISPECIES: LCP family glycopolymer transferase [Niallia]|jgi:polyisoprenyl-teichoic acid--peptidoglycan teichoic acid transferase|uniref:Transcriptional regulator LytR n=1 Tax=Niallia circulans TaxID=1397 RepID=A0A268FAT4_NIACI|nr:LCP family protein [Niallia circulans]AYV68979.1 transcriptional regulator LytR [Niallia circulans]AYV72629.1 transcriptional regulator LytR [Niallia circulans]NRG27994.1 LCP family protein [Niallia circulans]PAD82503.1 transcriptional regulator LytR [Niallia circulans]QJX60465.1 transcriptional regulator LytR [Niallia circulans]